MPKVLYLASEAHPLVKTGGLADVAGSLPTALLALGCEIRLVLPAYPDAVANAGALKKITELALPGHAPPVALWEGLLPGTELKIWLVDYPPAFNRSGHLYLDYGGHSWSDNAQRFALLARVAAEIAMNRAALGWRPEVVHCNDWQTGLTPALLARENPRPACVFTIHNLVYQGLYPHTTFISLGLPSELWSPDALEFHNQVSFIKGGLVFADRLTTVSPTYAQEIQTPELGCGLDGLLRHRQKKLSGILNGIDYQVWNPETDSLIVEHYHKQSLAKKSKNKTALQKAFSLPANPDLPVIGMIGRLVPQKGVDLVLEALSFFAQRKVQLVVLGSGDSALENTLRQQAEKYPEWLAVHIGFAEQLAHLIEAGADMFLMPSRFEPCGLNQLYSLRYGTIPIVHRTGGLADTVIDATPENIASGRATGYVFAKSNVTGLITAVTRALDFYHNKDAWRALAATGMEQIFNWRRSAEHYIEVYKQALDDLAKNQRANVSKEKRKTGKTFSRS